MGWGLRIFAAVAVLTALGLGLWLLSLLALAYFLVSFRRPKAQGALFPKGLAKLRIQSGCYALGAVLLLFAFVAIEAGGDVSPIVFSVGGFAFVIWPTLQRDGIAGMVVPMRESILLRSRLFPFRWYALAEVKLESQDQTRGIAALEGRLLLFAGKAPSAFKVVSVYAFGYREAEEKIASMLRSATRRLSQRGAHLLPLDSNDACRRLSVKLERLEVGPSGLGVFSSTTFDVLALQVDGGFMTRQRAFRVVASAKSAYVPTPDTADERRPILAEVVEEIAGRRGWPAPDEFSPFLAALEATRGEQLADRVWAKGEVDGKVGVEALGGVEARLTRAQLRAVAIVYA